MDETFCLAAILCQCRSFKFVSAPRGIAVALILRPPRKNHRVTPLLLEKKGTARNKKRSLPRDSKEMKTRDAMNCSKSSIRTSAPIRRLRDQMFSLLEIPKYDSTPFLPLSLFSRFRVLLERSGRSFSHFGHVHSPEKRSHSSEVHHWITKRKVTATVTTPHSFFRVWVREGLRSQGAPMRDVRIGWGRGYPENVDERTEVA